MCLKIYELDSKFISTPGLAWHANLKKTEVKLDLLTDFNMLLMVERGIIGGICNSIYRYPKANNKCMKNYDKIKESSYLNQWDIDTLYGWAMSQRFPTFYFEWVEDTSQFNEDFIKNYDEKNETTEFKPLNHRLLLPKVHREISFNKDEWVKPYIEMNANQGKKLKKYSKKISQIDE